MNILWITWKDHKHPKAGGAEMVSRELTQRLAADGHKVTLLTCGYEGAASHDKWQGVNIIRVGSNRYLHPFQALLHYVMHMRNSFDVVVEEVNAAPYFSTFFGKKARHFLFYHHLEREVWLHETPPPLNRLGYHVLEPLATRLLSLARVPLITVSESTKQDMARYGFDPARTHVISEGIEIEPIAKLGRAKKYPQPTLLSFGGVRAMKRTLDQVKAFELAKQWVPNLRLKVAGDISGDYGALVQRHIAASPYKQDIDVLGRVTIAEKVMLMRRSHLFMATSVKEGWGLTVTEAASQGTPTIAYDVPGLRDSVRDGQTGLITPEDPQHLADAIVTLFRDNPALYSKLQQAAWEWSKHITFDQGYKDFCQIVCADPAGARDDRELQPGGRLTESA